MIEARQKLRITLAETKKDIQVYGLQLQGLAGCIEAMLEAMKSNIEAIEELQEIEVLKGEGVK